jgi:hypothetical protein
MDELDKLFEVIGRIFVTLLRGGLRKQDLEYGALWRNLSSSEQELYQDLYDFARLFNDTVMWMEREQLIRFDTMISDSPASRFFGVQLTSHGLAIAIEPNGDQRETIQKQAARGELSTSVYTNIGSIVGGMLGGFTKSIS